MQIVRHATYVGTVTGLDGYLHRWAAPRKLVQRVSKINASTKSLVGRLCDFKIYAISVLSFIGSICAPDKATLKAENHALQCTTAGPYNAIFSKPLQVGSIYGVGPDLVVIHSISLAARYRVAACSSTLRRGLEKVNAVRGHNGAPLFALSSAWEHEFPFPSMAFNTANASATDANEVSGGTTRVHEDGGRDHDAPLVHFVLCDTVFNSSWSWRIRRCEVVRIGDRDYAGQIRVIQADENPSAWRSGSWVPRQCVKPNGKHVRLHLWS